LHKVNYKLEVKICNLLNSSSIFDYQVHCLEKLEVFIAEIEF
jgi:hypothetical protein